MFKPYVNLHYTRDNAVRENTEVVLPIEYPKELTEMHYIFEFGFKIDSENPVEGFRLVRVTVEMQPRIPVYD